MSALMINDCLELLPSLQTVLLIATQKQKRIRFTKKLIKTIFELRDSDSEFALCPTCPGTILLVSVKCFKVKTRLFNLENFLSHLLGCNSDFSVKQCEMLS